MKLDAIDVGNGEKELTLTLARAKKACRLIRSAIIVLMLLAIAACAVLGIGMLLEACKYGVYYLITTLYVFAYGGLVVLVLYKLLQVFTEVVQGDDPLSEKQADRFGVIAFSSLMVVLLELVFTAGFSYVAVPEWGYEIIVHDGFDGPTINLNIGMLVFSAIMYSLSAIFRYAALLQQLSDETV